MDIQSLIRGVLPTMDANATATAAAGNASSSTQHFQLESLLPMLGLRSLLPMYGLVGTWLGIDPTFILTAFGAVWALNKVARQIYGTAFAVTSEYLMSTIHISSNDDMYMHLMRWLAAQPKMTSSRSLTAETVSKTAWEDEDDSNVSRDKSGVYLNFSNQEAKAPPRFVPAVGLHSFWWGGTYFRLHRKQESVFDDGASSGFSTFKDREDLVISCLGRNPEPIKSLLKHVKESYYNNHHARTIVKRPSPMNLRRYGGRHCWQQVADRPIRDMRTVVLDNHQKMQVLADINEYLHPATPRWYANRGIPLRRGYLFHGPPGTGKTSLSFALAGVFGLDIYVISLLEPTLTEEDLGALPEAACRGAEQGRGGEEGGRRRQQQGNQQGQGGPSNDWKVSDLAKALKKESNNDDKKGISLSGLLNAIDGVASHEGRVLIMTTNVPESLDEALIRPGRVDLQVGFTNATREQARELFIRMYEADQGRRQQASGSGAATKTNGAAVVMAAANGKDPAATEKTKRGEDGGGGPAVAPETQSAMNSGDMDISVEELTEIAEQFAAKIPETKFSPAEIQGYLLKRKKHPLKAVEETDKWVDAMVQQKASKSKVLQVQ
ncbi:mitochondrial chaperone BCS1-B [Apiospora hydei]|uniref:Mitochondrial chaperone BCS1-B n=1 Tax=Apiospora hydei TaxID=1337664 RepID=A0ABR1V5U6_9PEZI